MPRGYGTIAVDSFRFCRNRCAQTRCLEDTQGHKGRENEAFYKGIFVGHKCSPLVGTVGTGFARGGVAKTVTWLNWRRPIRRVDASIGIQKIFWNATPAIVYYTIDDALFQ